MTDILIRNIDPTTVASIDASAIRLGLSRSEYLRRLLVRSVGAVDSVNQVPLTLEELRRSARRVADLADPEVMADAWR